MMLNKKVIVLLILSLVMLTGCSQFSPATVSPTPRVLLNTSVPQPVSQNLSVKSQVVLSESQADLAFITSGMVKSVNVKIGDTVKAGDVLIELDTSVIKAEIARDESAVKVAQAEYGYRKITAETPPIKPVDIPKLQAWMEQSAANVALADAELFRTQNGLKLYTLHAPIDGTILDVTVLPGETVYSGKIVIKMGNLQKLQVETLELSEMDIPSIYINQPVSVFVYALNRSMDGVVAEIAPQSTLVGDNRVYKVTIMLNEQLEGLKWGMSAETKFKLGK